MTATPLPTRLSLKAPHSLFIGGRWVEPSTDARLSVISPVTEEEVLSFAEAREADVDAAVAAARRAFDEGPWPWLPVAERAAYLRRVARELEARLEELAQAWTTQVGAPISFTRYASDRKST